MTQLALDLSPRARRRDPQTSHVAAEKAASKLEGNRQGICGIETNTPIGEIFD